MSDLLEELKRDVADPTNRTPTVLYVRALQAITTEGSTGDGRVVATVNGFGSLIRIRIGPELLSDVPRLERLVRKAVNLAINEAEKQKPLPPRSPLENPAGPRFFVPSPRARAASSASSWCDHILRPEESHREALADAAELIRERIRRDALNMPKELRGLILQVDLRLGDPGLTAASARRDAGIRDKSILRRFRRHAGMSLTEYIRRRKMETVARMIYRSDLALEEIATIFGFSGDRALARAIGRWWGGATPEELREAWETRGTDPVIWKWAIEGEATQGQAQEIVDELYRLYPSLGRG